MWIPPEERDPVVMHAPTRKSVALFGGVCVSDGRFAYHLEKIFNADSFKDFLKVLLRRRKKGKKILLILDNAKYHHAKALQPWLEDQKMHLELLFLPPYSPELNPIERVWKLVRRLCTHNQYFPTLDDLIAAITPKLTEWKSANTTLCKLCAI